MAQSLDFHSCLASSLAATTVVHDQQERERGTAWSHRRASGRTVRGKATPSSSGASDHQSTTYTRMLRKMSDAEVPETAADAEAGSGSENLSMAPDAEPFGPKLQNKPSDADKDAI